jgi:hypothetical protein
MRGFDMTKQSVIFENEAARRDFLRELQTMLLEGRPAEALVLAQEKLRKIPRAMGRYGSSGGTWAENVEFVGWRAIAAMVAAIRERRYEVTAVSFDLSSPSHFGLRPDEKGNLSPVVETCFYCDGPFPFSVASRAEIAAVCTGYATPWQGAFEEIDASIKVIGIDRIYGLTKLYESTLDRTPAEEDIYQLNAAIAAIIFHIALKRAVIEQGLPRSMTVLAGSHDDFPFYTSPVVTREEYGALPREQYSDQAQPDEEIAWFDPDESWDTLEPKLNSRFERVDTETGDASAEKTDGSSGDRQPRQRAQAQPEDKMKAAIFLGALAFVGAAKALEFGQKKLASAFSEGLANAFAEDLKDLFGKERR